MSGADWVEKLEALGARIIYDDTRHFDADRVAVGIELTLRNGVSFSAKGKSRREAIEAAAPQLGMWLQDMLREKLK